MSNAIAFKRFLVIRNPVSTSAGVAARRITEIQRAFPDIDCTVVETFPGGRSANAALLQPYAHDLGPDTLLCIAGGDGTVNMVIESLLTDPVLPPHARQTRVLPLWGGNANDLAHMLNGWVRPGSMATLLRTAAVCEVFPLACTLTDAHSATTTYLAAGYASFGASAITTKELSKQNVRARVALSKLAPVRFLGELLIATSTMTRASTFLALENNQRKTIYEYIFFNGPRFAKITGIKRRLTDQTFHKVSLEHKRLLGFIMSIVAVTQRRQANKFEATHAAFTALEATWAQFDGEAVHVYAGTKVNVDIAKQPFYALTTRESTKRQ